MIKVKYINFISLCFLVTLLISLYFNVQNRESITVFNNKEEKINYEEIINNLKNEYNNEDIIAVLKINNTNFSIPIVQRSNNDYYLNHSLTHEQDYMGSIFLDYRTNIDTSKKLLIYGHSYPKDNFPFNILENYYNEEYYDNYKYISLTTSKQKKTYEIFSIYVETSDFSYMDIDFVDSKDFYKHINNLKNKSIHTTKIELKEDDEILILQTCSNHKEYVNYDKKYLLIISRRIK